MNVSDDHPAHRDADACFALALDYLRRERWEDAAESLLDAQSLIPEYPHAADLLGMIGGIRASIMRGQDERPQIEAMRAYITKMQEPARDLATPARMLIRSDDSIVLPWAHDPPPLPRELPPLPGITPAPPLAPPKTDLPRLSALNPLDQLRVFVWFFLRPAALEVYRQEGRSGEVRKVSGWLAAALLWLPLAIPALGFVVGTLPGGAGLWWMLAVIVPLYLISGWLMSHRSAPAALMLASAAWFIFTPVLLAYIGVRAGALIALLFLLLAGFSGGIAGITANRTAIHLSLGAMFVGTTAAVLGMYRFIKPIVDNYTAGFILAGIGAPILIMLAVFFTGVLTLGLTYMLPFLGTYFVSYAVEAVLEDNFMMGASPMGVAALTGMAACYVILGWVSFAGGWQALANL